MWKDVETAIFLILAVVFVIFQSFLLDFRFSESACAGALQTDLDCIQRSQHAAAQCLRILKACSTAVALPCPAELPPASLHATVAVAVASAGSRLPGWFLAGSSLLPCHLV